MLAFISRNTRTPFSRIRLYYYFFPFFIYLFRARFLLVADCEDAKRA